MLFLYTNQNGSGFQLELFTQVGVGGDQDKNVMRTNDFFTLNEFHHVAVTSDASRYRMYVDGVERSTWFYRGEDDGEWYGDVHPAPGEKLTLGTRKYDADLYWYFRGIIDEVEVFDRALMPTEVTSIYDAGLAGKCKDDDGDGTFPPDDCDETDAGINPNALELPGNFVDENCNGDLGQCNPCFAWRNHGEYIRCVSNEVEQLVNAGYLTQEDGDSLVTDAARSDIGKKDYMPPECE